MALVRSLVLIAAAGAASAQDAISLGEPDWFSGKIVAQVLHDVIEDRFDREVEIVPGETREIFEGLLSGALDIHPDVWMPIHEGYVGQAISAGALALSATSYQGRTGICVPRYSAQRFGIQTVADLQREDVGRAFDTDGNGLGEFWLGAPGWQLTAAARVKLRDYGLDPFFEAVEEPEEAFEEDLYAGFARRRNMIFSCYEPLRWFAVEDIQFVEEPPHSPEDYVLVLPGQSEDWLGDSRISVADETFEVQVGFATRLGEESPELAAFLGRFGMSNADLTELLFLTQVKEFPLDLVVGDWIALNADRIDAWIDG